MTDTEKLNLIDHMITDFWEFDSGDEVCYATFINCIVSVIDFKEGEK